MKKCAFIIAILFFAQASTAEEKLAGSCTFKKGIRVLHLDGKPYDIGYAHGYLLAYEIVSTFNSYISIIAAPRQPVPQANLYDRYKRIRKEASSVYYFSEDELSELKGMLAGIKAKLGDRAIAFYGKPFDLTDLKVLQTLPDWYQVGCASFIVWNPNAIKNGTIVGRNLDFMPHPVLFANHLITYRKKKDKRSYITMGWPGIIGALTGLREDGLFVCIHDSDADLEEPLANSLPRMSAARMLLESADAKDIKKSSENLLKKYPSRWGGLVIVATDKADSAAIFERERSDMKMRDISNKLTGEPDGALYATNHFRTLYEPYECWRYYTFTRNINRNINAKNIYTLKRAVAQMMAVKQSITLQTMTANLKTLDTRFRFRGILNDVEFSISWKELSKKKDK